MIDEKDEYKYDRLSCDLNNIETLSSFMGNCGLATIDHRFYERI